MQDMEKAEKINALLAQLFKLNTKYQVRKEQYFFDYDSVISALEDVVDKIEGTLMCERPHDLPTDIPWCERAWDDGEEFNPYVYDRTMSIKDYKLMHQNISEDRRKRRGQEQER